MAQPRLLTAEDALDIARGRFGSASGVRVLRWREWRPGGGPEGFLGSHLRVEVEAAAGADADADKIEVFVKSLPSNENQRRLIQECGVFRKEAGFYATIVAQWEKRGIIPSTSVAERRKEKQEGVISWNCRWYIARDDLIALENIAPLGYSTYSVRQPLDYARCVLVMETLANFHAASLIYEEEKSAELGREFRIGKDHADVTFETFYVEKEEHPGSKAVEATVHTFLECAKLLPICSDEGVWAKVKAGLPKVMRKMYDVVGASEKHRNVICHADLWQNNIMFAKNGDVKLVDFQLLRYAPPAHDIFDFLHLTTRRDFRLRHEKALLEEYWLALKCALGRRGLDIENVLPRSDFDASLPEQKFAGRLSGVYVVHFITSGAEAMNRMFGDSEAYERIVYEGPGRAEHVLSQFKYDPEYKERVLEALTELIDCDVLSSGE